MSNAKRILRIALVVMAVLAVAGLFARQWKQETNTRRMHEHFAQFRHDAKLATFDDVRPKIYQPGTKPYRHAVVLYHGYSGATSEYDSVARALQEAGIMFYAPRITGFGLDDFHLLWQVRSSDWLRDAVEAYDLVASMADEVSIVGQSTGGTLAALVAMERPARELVLVGPNFFQSPSDIKYKTLLNSPILGPMIEFAVPVFAKPTRPGRVMPSDTLDPVAARSAFSYLCLPTRSLIPMYELQDMVDISKARFERLSIMYGAKDATVDNARTLERLKTLGIGFESHVFPRSGHNIFQDYDRDDAVVKLVEILGGR